jgi:hypothetical protein
MYTAAVYLLLPLMWVNLTVGENKWEILGLGIGQALYWVIIALGWYITSRSPYQRLATCMVLLAFALRAVEVMGGGVAAYALRIGALGTVFAVAGAWVYGRNPHFLHRQLTVFLALCVPIMLLQILGVSSFFMGWSTGYLHDPTIMDEADVGTFMEVPLYPTLFVASEDLTFSIGQARPVGLMHSSNVLSIFVAVAVALNLVLPRSARLRASDLIITAALVLTMSKMVFVVAAVLYLGALMFAAPRRVLALNLLGVLAAGIGLYYLLFPGLLQSNFSEEMVRTSIMLRLLGVVNAIGIANVGSFLYDQQQLIGSAFSEDESYSSVAVLLNSGFVMPALAALAVGGLFYLYRMRQMGVGNAAGYAVILFVCAATQLAIPFVAASSFQFMLGLAMFPLFRKLWHGHVAEPVQDDVPAHPRLPAAY